MSETGKISIHTDNILPIIKKWLYSDKDIFIRELVSNAADAVSKLEKLNLTGDVKKEIKEPRIDISIDKPNRKITISDTGLGMTSEEIKKYINQVAFSGVEDFVKKYENEKSEIIGHFGLGFYSSFMVSSKVEIESLSYQEGAQPAHWESTGDGNFTLKDGARKDVGTTITLHVNEDEDDILDVYNIRNIASKYCGFMKYPVYLQDENISDSKPLWTENPSQVSDDQYKEFFRKLFPMAEDPLFWIHINVDYPFNLRGILYFPRISHELQASEGQVKLFCNQVYVEDNCKELIPEYLTLLKGVIDCPDLPLNVSRSALQKDAQVVKITQHITKKVADKLSGMCKTDREMYEGFWKDINPFVKYAMIRDRQFFDRMIDHVLFKVSDQSNKTLKEYVEAYKTENKIIYASDESTQSDLISMWQKEGVEVAIADRTLDQHFIPYVEMQSETKYKFERVDADISKFKDSDANEIADPSDQKTPSEKITEIFSGLYNSLEIKVEGLKNSNTPAVFVVEENARRMGEMVKTNPIAALSGGLGDSKKSLVINKNSAAIKNLLRLSRVPGRETDTNLIAKQVHDLAVLQQGMIEPEGMKDFITRTQEVLSRVGLSSS